MEYSGPELRREGHQITTQPENTMPIKRLSKSEVSTLTRAAVLLDTIGKMFGDEQAASASESVSVVVKQYADEPKPKEAE